MEYIKTEKIHWFRISDDELKQVIYELDLLLEDKSGFDILVQLLTKFKNYPP